MENAASNKNSAPVISIIVPVLNEEKLLRKNLMSLRSAIDFSEVPIELIVCDGGSTDGSIEISRQLADKTIDQQGRYRTIAEGRNNGASAATGNVLVFINADTYPRNPYQFISELARFAHNDKFIAEGVFVHGDATIEDNGLLGYFDRFFHFATNWYFWSATKLGFTMARGECMITKRDVFLAIGGFRGNLVAGEDVDFYRRLSKKGKISINKKVVVIESSRRFISEGYFSTMGRWFLNDVSVRLRGKAFSKEWGRTDTATE
jgi:glycosyltransferase involved in cell wall biosynthesis